MLHNIITDNYVKAFIKVAEMLEPNATFESVIEETKLTEGGYEKKVYVNGKMDNMLVIVTTEKNANKGLQLVLTYVNPTSGETKRRSYWYFSFNWKGLTASADLP